MGMSSPAETSSKPFEPGTTGWTAADLDDPEVERRWFAGRYEIVEGVLTRMPAAYFTGSGALQDLIFQLRTYFATHGPKGRFATEVDIVINDVRVCVADAVFLTTAEQKRQNAAARDAGRPDPDRTRILVPPTLIIESVSPGHEVHDYRTKRRWYAEFDVPNCWVLDAYARTLECLALRGGAYDTDAKGENAAELMPAAFPSLRIALAELWGE